jgi:hypothetical protein
MNGLFRTAESLLMALGIMLFSLIALYGVMSLLIKYAPSPISGWFGGLAARSTPGGWGIGTSNS